MQTKTKITLYLTDTEFSVLLNAVELLTDIDNLFDLDPEMRKDVNKALNSIDNIIENVESESDISEEER